MLEKKDYLASVAPHDYSVTGTNVDVTSTEKIMDDFLAQSGNQVNEKAEDNLPLLWYQRQAKKIS